MKDKPHLSFKEMMQFVSESWKDLGEADKTYFQGKAEIDKERYHRQMAEFHDWGKRNPALLQALDAQGGRRKGAKAQNAAIQNLMATQQAAAAAKA